MGIFMKTSKKEKGFTLVEILIALSLAIFGLFAILSLIMGALKNQQVSEYRRSAVSLTNLIADKMRANAAGAPYYDMFEHTDPNGNKVNGLNSSDLEDPYGIFKYINEEYLDDSARVKECDSQPSGLDLVGGCDEQKLAKNDLIFWEKIIQYDLPSGVGMVRRVEELDHTGAKKVASQNLYQVMIMWYEKPGKGEDDVLDPECTFPTMDVKNAWTDATIPTPKDGFKNYRCKVTTISL